MKLFLLAAILLAAAAPIAGQCGDATVSPSDTIGSVKAKLACMAGQLAAAQAEIERLKNENVNLKENPTPPLITWSGKNRSADFSVEQCKSKATDVVLDRGGTVFSHGDSWVAFLLANTTVVVECNAQQTAYVISAGCGVQDSKRDADLGALLRDAIIH